MAHTIASGRRPALDACDETRNDETGDALTHRHHGPRDARPQVSNKTPADSQELDTGILLVIMFNCVIMAFPPNKLKMPPHRRTFCLADFILNFIFFCEFAIKFYAYGLAYFKDTWNQLDFVVVCQGTLSMTTECPYVFGRSSGVV